jgi:hypothetical protein
MDQEFDNGFRVRYLADQNGTLIAEVIDPPDADLKGWSVEVAKRSDPAAPSHIEEFVREWRGTRYKWEALVDSDEIIVRWIPPSPQRPQDG